VLGEVMNIKDVFKMPTPVKITGRTSSITNAFVNGIVPCIEPTEEEISKVLEILGMNHHTIRCAYCGDKYTEWDHFRPLIHRKRPTGYISEIHNLIPACGKCNQSKGNSYWKEWILGDAPLSPKNRIIFNLEQIRSRLEDYETWSNPTIVDFESMVGKDIWEKHWENCVRLHEMMQESQKLSDQIKIAVAKGLDNGSKVEPIKVNTLQSKVDIQTSIGEKVGTIAQTDLKRILESNRIPIEEIKLLLTETYSKDTFDINFPLLKEVDWTKNFDEQKRDSRGYNRYYKAPIVIHGKKYLLCSQWYENNKPFLIKWIELNVLVNS
jgi:hypothetical protein